MKRAINIGKEYNVEVVLMSTRNGLQEQFRRVYAPEPNYTRYARATQDDVDAVQRTVEYQTLRAYAEADLEAKRAEQEANRIQEARVASEMAELLRRARAEGIPCYLRYRQPPSGGRSYNSRDGVYEAGVSVYRAYRLGDRYVIDLTGHDVFSSLFISQSNEDLYLVTGEEIGTGADGEPVLRNVHIVRRVPRESVDLAWE